MFGDGRGLNIVITPLNLYFEFTDDITLNIKIIGFFYGCFIHPHSPTVFTHMNARVTVFWTLTDSCTDLKATEEANEEAIGPDYENLPGIGKALNKTCM